MTHQGSLDGFGSGSASVPEQIAHAAKRLAGATNLGFEAGGCVSGKGVEKDLLGRSVEALYVSGYEETAAAIEEGHLHAFRREELRAWVDWEGANEVDWMRACHALLLKPPATLPPLGALLHAAFPQRFVLQAPVDAVLTLGSTPDGDERLRTLFQGHAAVLPAEASPILSARRIAAWIRDGGMAGGEGLVCRGIGLFTFDDSAEKAHASLLRLAALAEAGLPRRTRQERAAAAFPAPDARRIAAVRQAVSASNGRAQIALFDGDGASWELAQEAGAEVAALKGALAPHDARRLGPLPLVLEDDPASALATFAQRRKEREAASDRRDPLSESMPPHWAIWKGAGMLSFGDGWAEADARRGRVRLNAKAILDAEALQGWSPPAFERWSTDATSVSLLPRAATQAYAWDPRETARKPLQGKIALVTGAAGGIGLACARLLRAQGAAVAGLDIDPKITSVLHGGDLRGFVCDLGDGASVARSVEDVVRAFGGLDILVSNAGIFTAGQNIEDLEDSVWERSLRINLSGAEKILQCCIPYLKLGVDPAVVLMGSRNVTAPGAGAAAYSVAKAGLTQLGRVAALELGRHGVRVNVLHPDAVFDTNLWTPEALQRSADRYGLTVEEYKTRNIMKTEITSMDVAAMVAAMVGPLFSKTTGAQIPIDGGNDRVI